MGAPVVHFEVHGEDLKVLSEFYSKLFGWEVHEAMPGQYGLVHTNAEGKGIDGGIGAGGQWQGPPVTFYMEVDDPQKYLEQAESLGGKVVMPVTEIPNSVTFGLFSDPEGHVLGVLKAE
jgi:predicted enzyme related to lactoylglutathione lyase